MLLCQAPDTGMLTHVLRESSVRMSETDIIANQKLIIENQKTILANQDIIKQNQATLQTIVKNQERILALLQK